MIQSFQCCYYFQSHILQDFPLNCDHLLEFQNIGLHHIYYKATLLLAYHTRETPSLSKTAANSLQKLNNPVPALLHFHYYLYGLAKFSLDGQTQHQVNHLKL